MSLSERTDNRRFASIYSPGSFVTAAQYLAEYVCGRQARAKHITLPAHFWKTMPEWEKQYLLQLRHANALLKIYEPAAVSAALRSKEGQKVLSLGAKWLDDMIKKEQLLLADVKQGPEGSCETNVPKQSFKKKSLKDKLD